MEDENATEDRSEVGRHGGQRDDLDAVADLEAAGRGVEGDHSRDERGESPWAQQPQQRPWLRVGEVLDGDIGDTPQRAGGRAEE